MLAAIFAIPRGIGEWGRLILVALAIAAPCFLLGQCEGKRSERAAWEAKAARAQAEAERRQREADRQRHEAEQADRARIQNNRQEVDNAVQDIGDQPTSARQRARACLELRRQAAAAGQPEPAC